ncbi:MAG TPA: response regulator [Longimicrobiaceae bacterium]|nr:response regulator [Longimicrobiaceae bacterium]
MSTGEPSGALLLLVEDNETIRNAFAILLEESGYAVLQAAKGADALRIAGERRPDLILLDLGLPDIGGLQVARTLKSREETRHIPIVALTGRALETDQEACRAAGCSGYLTKPINTEDLLRQVPEFIRGVGNSTAS